MFMSSWRTAIKEVNDWAPSIKNIIRILMQCSQDELDLFRSCLPICGLSKKIFVDKTCIWKVFFLRQNEWEYHFWRKKTYKTYIYIAMLSIGVRYRIIFTIHSCNKQNIDIYDLSDILLRRTFGNFFSNIYIFFINVCDSCTMLTHCLLEKESQIKRFSGYYHGLLLYYLCSHMCKTTIINHIVLVYNVVHQVLVQHEFA